MDQREDIQYINSVLEGDINAFSFLVERHKDFVYTMCLKIVRNPEDAEEIAQDVFLKAYRSLGSFRKESKFSTWLYRICYNTSISHTRKKRHEFSGVDEHIIENYSDEDVQPLLEGKPEEEKIKMMEEAISRLPEEENLIITLFYKENQGVQELASITGLSQSNIKVKLYRIRKKLYNELYKKVNML